jgi:exodeoxyribonuclease V alpha subunit
MFMQHYLMLSRNLLYTGLTRAKQLAILVGPPKAIGIAVRQVKDQERYTLLSERLMSANTTGLTEPIRKQSNLTK